MSQPVKKKPNNLSPKDYSEAKSMWKSGNYTLKVLAEKFGISVTAFNRRFKRDNIKKGCEADRHQKAVEEILKSSSTPIEANTASIIAERQEFVHRVIEHFGKRSANIIMTCSKENKPLASVSEDLKALQVAQKIVSDGWDVTAKMFGLDKNQSKIKKLTELKIDVLSEEALKEIKEAQRSQESDPIDEPFQIEHDIEMVEDKIVSIADEIIEDVDEEIHSYLNEDGEE
jgi:hypothetical protein